MKICLVTAFPPSRQGLNEYGFHIARELSQYPGLSLTILSDDLPKPEPELAGYNVIRCWSFDSLKNPVRLLRTICRLRPDVVWFNLGFASFGGSPLPAFVGLAIPALTRMSGYYTHVTLHQLVETVDLTDAGVKSQTLYKIAGSIATHMLLTSNSLSVLLPAYRKILRERYRRGSVYVRAHGILSGRPEYPDLVKRGNPVHRILAFGKWGTYKRLEQLIDAFHRVEQLMPNVCLTIAGGDHPKTPGYVASVAKKYRENPKLEFTGYVPEEDIPALFQSTSLTVMPYSSSAGSSGVAHLACEYGVPIVASDISDFRELSQEEGIAIDLYKAGDLENLAEHLVNLLQSPEQLETMAIQNFSAALRMSMPEIIRQYIRSFDMQRKLKVLRAASRLRRMPRWMPLRPAFRGRVGRKLASWQDSAFASYMEPVLAEASAQEASQPSTRSNVGLDPEDTVDDTLSRPLPNGDGRTPRNGHNGDGKALLRTNVGIPHLETRVAREKADREKFPPGDGTTAA